MSRVPVLPDSAPLLTDSTAKQPKRRWTPLRVFAWTFLFASLLLWATAQPGVQQLGRKIGEAAAEAAGPDRVSTVHRLGETILPRD